VKIIPERVTVFPDAPRNELTVIMEGFRLTLTVDEARSLSYALAQGVKLLPAETGARPFMPAPSSPSSPHKPAAAPFGQETATSKPGDAAPEVVRSLSA
jgi:hypothetical protein